MNKKLQYVIAFSCLLVAGSIAYYLSIYIPKQHTIAEQRDCEKIAEERVQKEVETFLADDSAGELPQTKYVYSKKTNQCVFWIKSAYKDTNETLFDLFTLKGIAFYTDARDGAKYGDKEDFQKKYNMYFGK